MLNCMDYLIYRLLFTISNLVERRFAQGSGIADDKRATQVGFGNVVNVGDHMQGHPGTNRPHISYFDRAVLLLKIVYRLRGIDSSKDQHAQYE